MLIKGEDEEFKKLIYLNDVMEIITNLISNINSTKFILEEHNTTIDLICKQPEF